MSTQKSDPAERKPVAWVNPRDLIEDMHIDCWHVETKYHTIPLFTTPQPCPMCADLAVTNADIQDELMQTRRERGELAREIESLEELRDTLQAKVAELTQDNIRLNTGWNYANEDALFSKLELTRTESVIEKCIPVLKLNLEFMDTQVADRKVQPYTQTYDLIATIETYQEGKKS